MTKVWKWVFRNCFGELESAIISVSAVKVQYEPGRWAEPPQWLLEKGYGLCAFKDLKSARKLWRGGVAPGFELWEAEADEVWDPAVPPGQFLEREGELPELRPLPSASWPKGTVMARRLKLLKKVGGVL